MQYKYAPGQKPNQQPMPDTTRPPVGVPLPKRGP